MGFENLTVLLYAYGMCLDGCQHCMSVGGCLQVN